MRSLRSPLTLALTSLLGLCVACDGGKAEPAAKKDDAAKPAADAKASTGAKAAATGAKEAAGSDEHVVKITDKELERLRLMGTEVHKHLEKAGTAQSAGDWRSAARSYGEALKPNDDNPQILAAMG